MRKNIIVTFAVTAALMLNVCNLYAEENTNKYDLKGIQDILIKDSFEVKKIEANERLLTVKYEETIKSYNEDMENLIKNEDTVSKVNENLKKAIDEGITEAVQPITKNYYLTKERYKGLVAIRTEQMKSYEPIILQRKQAARSKENEILKSKFSLQKDYYNFLVVTKEKDLLEKDIANIKQQVETEKLKTNYGISTTISVDELENQLASYENQLNDLKNNCDLLTESLKTKLNIKVEDKLDLKLDLPAKEAELTYTLADTVKNMKDKSLDFETVKNNTKIYSDINEKFKLAYLNNNTYEISNNDQLKQEEKDQLSTCELELSLGQIEEQNLERKIELYAKQAYYDYKKAVLDLDASDDSLKLLKDKAGIIDLNYQQGIISELQYNIQKQDIERKTFEAQKATIAYENARRNLELANMGIMISE